MIEFTARQEELLNNIESELRKQTALEYIKLGYENKTQAYINACAELGKEPSKNPTTSGVEILGYPRVVDFINEMRLEVAKATQTDATYVLNRLRQIDELDVIDIVNDDLSGFKPLSEWPIEWRKSVSGIDMKRMIQGGEEQIEAVIEKVKWPDKVKNLEMIGRHVEVKAWEKEVEVTSVTNNIMPVPCATSVDDWEKAAQSQQSEALSHD